MPVKIALIDTGIDEKNQTVKDHFYVKNGKVINGCTQSNHQHATLCLKEMVKNNCNFEIVDFNVVSETGQIIVKNVILAIKRAIELKVDIINMSLGVSEYSHELFLACQEAANNNILIIAAASHDGTVIYPADFKNVLKVETVSNQNEKLKKINDSTLSLFLPEYLIDIDDKPFYIYSTSLAAAYFCGYFAKIISSIPLCDKFQILYKKFGIELNLKPRFLTYNKDKNKIKTFLTEKRWGFIILPDISNCHDFLDFSKILPNFIAYYDHQKKCFLNCKTDKVESDFNSVLIINTGTQEIDISNNWDSSLFKDKEIFLIGNFGTQERDLSNLLLSYDSLFSDGFHNIERPIILVCGVGKDVSKFEVHTNLVFNFEREGFDIYSITNNYLGVLYNFEVFKYPENVVFPDTVLAINSYMWKAEMEEEPDAWLVNIGGGISKINNTNVFNFGKLSEAFLHATNADIVVLCVNISTSLEFINQQIKQFSYYGVNCVYLVLADKTFDESTLDASTGLAYIQADSEKYSATLKYMREHIKTGVFSINDVQHGELYKAVVKRLKK